jgi:hypothetical protein
MPVAFEELARAEPRLRELEAEARAVSDDGRASFFCSNYRWLPLNGRLRELLGVARIPVPGDEARPLLYDSRAYEEAFGHLSRLLPPCRDCGCRIFQGFRDSREA